MSPDFCETALFLYLKHRDQMLCGKVLELREAVHKWLEYIPQSFPHYTRHTIGHSDAIIQRISKLLFESGEPSRPVCSFSAMEAYILCAAAYLHDAGMVVSDQGKAQILTSEPWRAWISEGSPGARRSTDIEAFRVGPVPEDSSLRNFLADVQLRHLIAEFVRRTHHWRTEGLLSQNQANFGRFALDDPILLRTISDVCIAHGTDRRELEDCDRYPERRDICGQEVSVRFMAILVRLGDLLDMSTDRACPLLLSAACPLPADSLAHWTKYQRVTHFLVSPDRIEIVARCRHQEEHRIMKDWCSWLASEAGNGTILMARSARHAGWIAPTATMDCPNPTIRIEPAADASYIPSSWKFELDQELVYRRLVQDLYVDPLSFVRELIQNSLDATRCQLYLDLRAGGIPAPDYPTQVADNLRQRYLIRISLETRSHVNPLSGEVEMRQVLVVEDPGIGMDRDIIERYLLQVGRSYYTTVDFQRNFKFVPTSRFGLGFLSVFGASDLVTVETYKPTLGGEPLRLVLTGPRNYILLEKGSRRNTGTRIEVSLREAIKSQALTQAVSRWCRRVEFPIVVKESEIETTIQAERKDQFIYEMQDIMKEDARFLIRAFPIERDGLEGEIYIFARRDGNCESWDAWRDAKYIYPKSDPRATPPQFPESLTCINGMSVDEHSTFGPHSERLDFRGGNIPVPSLSRERARFWRGREAADDDRVTSRWSEILNEHLRTCERANSPEGWKYKQALVDLYPTREYWASIPDTIPVHSLNRLGTTSLNEIDQSPVFATILSSQTRRTFPFEENDPGPNPEWTETLPAIFDDELAALSKTHRKQIFRTRTIGSVCWLPSRHLAIRWRKQEDGAFGGPSYRPSYLAELPTSFTVGFGIHTVGEENVLGSVLLNSKNPLVLWLASVKEAVNRKQSGVSQDAYETLYELISECCQLPFKLREIAKYIDAWRRMPGLSGDLRPPEWNLVSSMFIRIPDPENIQS